MNPRIKYTPEQEMHRVILSAAGFSSIATTTKAGTLLSETWFNKDGVRIDISYEYLDPEDRPQRVWDVEE